MQELLTWLLSDTAGWHSRCYTILVISWGFTGTEQLACNVMYTFARCVRARSSDTET